MKGKADLDDIKMLLSEKKDVPEDLTRMLEELKEGLDSLKEGRDKVTDKQLKYSIKIYHSYSITVIIV